MGLDLPEPMEASIAITLGPIEDAGAQEINKLAQSPRVRSWVGFGSPVRA